MESQGKHLRSAPEELNWERFGLDGSRNTSRKNITTFNVNFLANVFLLSV